MVYYIYAIRNLLNSNHLYVGQTDSPRRRWNEHRAVSRKGKEKAKRKFSAVHAAISKYGEENFAFIIIDTTNKPELLDNLEIQWVGQLRDSGYELYNETGGGKAPRGKDHPWFGRRHSEESKRKISDARQGKYFGKNNHFFGKKHTGETKTKMSQNSKAHIVNITPEYRKTMSKAKTGETNGNNTLMEKDAQRILIAYYEIDIEQRKMRGFKTNFCRNEASRYGVDPVSINFLISGKTWKTLFAKITANYELDEKRPKTKLSLDDVKRIRALLSGEKPPSTKDLARLYKVSKGTIELVKNNKTWKE